MSGVLLVFLTIAALLCVSSQTIPERRLARSTHEAHNASVGSISSWCPKAPRCSVRGSCGCATDQKWLFIWATGRSGSTTVKNMVNALPGIALSGENGLLASVAQVYDKFQALRTRRAGTSSAWEHGKVDHSEFVCAVQSVFRSVRPRKPHQNAILGFKEIRFSPSQLKFLQAVFPCARFVFSIRRDIENQAKSAFYKKQDPQKSQRRLKRRNTYIREIHKTMGPDTSFLLELEDFNKTKFNELLVWLGYTGCEYTRVLHANDGGFFEDAGDADLLQGSCLFRHKS